MQGFYFVKYIIVRSVETNQVCKSKVRRESTKIGEKGPAFVELIEYRTEYFATVAVCDQIYSERLSYLEDLMREIILNISDRDYCLAKY